jgi:hypothetical protein
MLPTRYGHRFGGPVGARERDESGYRAYSEGGDDRRERSDLR